MTEKMALNISHVIIIELFSLLEIINCCSFRLIDRSELSKNSH